MLALDQQGALNSRRPTNNRLYLDPLVADASADGCTRVGIHPMAFLGRTARLREFKFQDNLRVGEHEQLLGDLISGLGGSPKSRWPRFFYSNKYLGLQAAAPRLLLLAASWLQVCFDSTFPHFRVKVQGTCS